ncbi:MAG: hypothetical protein V7K89_01105 [Nostoc sp.]|uniref:hypothetical protein n=1 Tax=Nostoc sp. TaxID=1180 RepID=UPI002FFB6767
MRIDDLIIGGYGTSYVVFGGTNIGIGGSLKPSSLDGTNSFVINNDTFNSLVSNKRLLLAQPLRRRSVTRRACRRLSQRRREDSAPLWFPDLYPSGEAS